MIWYAFLRDLDMVRSGVFFVVKTPVQGSGNFAASCLCRHIFLSLHRVPCASYRTVHPHGDRQFRVSLRFCVFDDGSLPRNHRKLTGSGNADSCLFRALRTLMIPSRS